jgi:subtilase family serine protease
VAILGATGDWGSETGTQSEYPATSPEVVAVGGTTLSTSGNSRGYSETAWNKAGSGCSSIFAKPSYQTNDTTCGNKRGEADISADADPNSGITIYVNGAQSQYGGTSLATPIVAGIWALAGVPNSGDNPAAYPYAHTGNFFDVTSGSNGSCGTIICNAGTGWDGPTGWGTPNGVTGLQPGSPSGGSPTVQNPGDQTVTVGQAVNLQLHVSGGTSPYSWAADALPAGLALDKATGVISGKPTATGSTKTTVTVTDNAGKTGSTTFNWTVNQAGQVTVANPGNQTGTVGKSASLQISASGGTSPYSYSAKGLPTGLAIDSKSGLISGTPSAAGSYSVVVTATDSTGASGQTNFTWTVNPAPASQLSATFSTDYDYGWGAFTHFTITNNGTTAVNSWSLAFDVPSNESLQLTNPGTASGSTGHVVVTGNYQIPPGGSITVNQTYQVNSGSFTPPTNVVVTGS